MSGVQGEGHEGELHAGGAEAPEGCIQRRLLLSGRRKDPGADRQGFCRRVLCSVFAVQLAEALPSELLSSIAAISGCSLPENASRTWITCPFAGSSTRSSCQSGCAASWIDSCWLTGKSPCPLVRQENSPPPAEGQRTRSVAITCPAGQQFLLQILRDLRKLVDEVVGLRLSVRSVHVEHSPLSAVSVDAHGR